MDFHDRSISQVFSDLQTGKTGLSQAYVVSYQQEHARNVLPSSGAVSSRMQVFFRQWKSPLILLLLVAGAISGMLGEVVDLAIIWGTAGLNALIGFFQEDKANRALETLKRLIQYPAFVLRDGKKFQIDSTDLVPGDIVLLQAGDKIQADGRVIEAHDFVVNEATLTGESEPVSKQTKKFPTDTATFDRHNLVYKGTVVVNGTARVVVTRIGEETEIGKVASLVHDTVEELTPLQKQLSRLGKQIGLIVVGISFFIIGAGYLFSGGEDLLLLFETAVAVAVAAVPEGMVISLTVILAIGMQFILKRGALVRRLVAAETLGSVSVICSDKTGTLTEGNMYVTRLVVGKDDLSYVQLQSLRYSDASSDHAFAIRLGVLCNDAMMQASNREEVQYVGDTTDIALLRLGEESGAKQDVLGTSFTRLHEIPFDSDRKYMATLHDMNDGHVLFVKGASDILLGRCTHYREGGKKKKLTKAARLMFADREHEMTSSGLRVLGLAYRDMEKARKISDTDVQELVFVGFVALSDPLRSDVKDTLRLARRAGITITMITGDHVKTAMSIARELGFRVSDDRVFDGSALDGISDDELQQVVKRATVFARVDPKHKIRIVRAFQANGEVVAMTGDGVNDAPALKGADIGVALGSGTDVAKETADIVLTNDSLTTIVAAVGQGRTIYQNIRKVVLYLLSGSFSEVILVMGSIIAGLPLAALPAQILWVNIIEDAFPTMALAFDKGDASNMDDPPRRKGEKLLNGELKTYIFVNSIVANAVLFAIFVWLWRTTGDIALTRTVVFTAFAIDGMFFIFSIRNTKRMIWQMNPFSNRYLLAALGFGFSMLLLAIYWGPLQALLHTVPLAWPYWGLIVGFGVFNLFLIEFVKFLFLVRSRAFRS